MRKYSRLPASFWLEKDPSVTAAVIESPVDGLVVARSGQQVFRPVVRDYLTGTTGTSIWPMYKSGRREIYGIRFPDGLRENQRLPGTIITPTTKAAEGEHDEPVTPDQIIRRGLLTREHWQNASELALALFARGRAAAAERGLILVDTKYEFGLDAAGRIILADEIHTPDSSRYWLAESYEQRFAAGQSPESLDKDFVRRWVSERCNPYRDPIPEIPSEVILEAARIYIDVFETITGESFVVPPSDTPILDRIRANLARYFEARTEPSR